MTTPRFELDTYQQGDDNWSHTDTVEFVDEYSIDKGPVSERPASGDYDDELYFATDQGLLWRWDVNISDWTTNAFGTETERVPDTSYFDGVDANSVSTEAVSSNVAQRPADYIVYQNDAETKATRTEDSLVEYQGDRGGAIIADILDDHIGEPLRIHLRAGTYLTEWGEIFLDSEQALVGDQRASTIIKAVEEPEGVDDNIGLINVDGGANGRDDEITDYLIESLTIDGRDRDILTGEYEGLELDGCFDGISRDLWIKNTPGDGVDIDFAEQNIGENIIIENCGDGWHNSSEAHENTAINVECRECSVSFTQQNGARSNTFINPTSKNPRDRHFELIREDGGGGAFVVNPKLFGREDDRSILEGITGGLDTHPFVFRDDFAAHDGGIDERPMAVGHNFDHADFGRPKISEYRPNWRPVDGEPTIEDGQMVLQEGDRAWRDPIQDVWREGTIQFVYQFAESPDGTCEMRLHDLDGGDILTIRVSDFNDLIRIEDQDGNDFMETTWDVDTDEHVIELGSDGLGSWTLYLDGSQEDTSDDGPIFDGEERVFLRNDSHDGEFFAKYVNLTEKKVAEN